ncbi:MDR family MFS transporter [Roseicyclus sp. F158]|uniref:MDR family MFS transporter n=1 Tax=Tropicimonas omnivorans TaxID=3075590 RepID=A0ABU3DGH8_9RHOB|nr:MDR family MFS transporter [Roseicyclus sp. F158]MDT0682663.1 MDR family MFS transporter [Roseicyclus sp. F158]
MVLAAVALSLLFASLGQTIVSTALPIIAADLGGIDNLTWLITAYLLASTVAAPVSGKLGDLFGRKAVMQGAIAIFVVGAVIAGLAPSMGVLIAGRAVQGLGGGSLIVVSMAVVGDVLPPRDRGKAQGILGAVFGVSTVLGPLIGGFLVEALSWHWIFFVNMPVGALAFVVIAAALETPAPGIRPRIDYAGAASLAAFLSAIVLIANMGGSAVPWVSGTMALLLAIAVGALVGFVAAERRASQPILPLELFGNNTFLVVNGVGFFVGVAMFGTITFMPLYLQVVQGVTPTVSGLFLLPMMGGLIAASTAAGQLMSRTGRYKLLPIISTAILAVSLLTMTVLSSETPLWVIAAGMLGIGLGLGPVFSVGVAAIQNAVPPQMLGVGTASANMFRLIGGSIGTAAFGAIFASGLSANIAGHISGDLSGGVRSVSAEMVASLPAADRVTVLEGFSNALHPIFFAGAVLAILACLLSLRLRELPLGTTLPGARP